MDENPMPVDETVKPAEEEMPAEGGDDATTEAPAAPADEETAM